MAKFVNLTPHKIVVVSPSGETILEVAPSGAVARVATTTEPVSSAAGVPLVRQSFGQVTDLPAPREGVLLIVSGMVRSALPNRADLASPSGLVRDDQGRVKGCSALAVN